MQGDWQMCRCPAFYGFTACGTTLRWSVDEECVSGRRVAGREPPPASHMAHAHAHATGREPPPHHRPARQLARLVSRSPFHQRPISSEVDLALFLGQPSELDFAFLLGQPRALRRLRWRLPLGHHAVRATHMGAHGSNAAERVCGDWRRRRGRAP